MNNWNWGCSNPSPKGDMGFGVFRNDHRIQDVTTAVEETDITKQVDNLFSGRFHDSDEWLMTLRNAAAAAAESPGPGPIVRRLEPTKSSGAASLYSSNSNSNSSFSGSGNVTPLPLPSQLDFTMLREFEILQQTANSNSYSSDESGNVTPLPLPPNQLDFTMQEFELIRKTAERMIQQISPEPGHEQRQGMRSPRGNGGPFERRLEMERTPRRGWPDSGHMMSYYDQEYRDGDNGGPCSDDIGYPRSARRRVRRLCRFCCKNGERPVWYTSHNLHEKNSNIVACPVLRNYECKQCGATGDYAHTDSYCPFRFTGREASGAGASVYGLSDYNSYGKQQTRRSRRSGEAPFWHQEDFPPLHNN